MLDFLTFAETKIDEHVIRVLVIILLGLLARMVISSAANSFIKTISSENPRGKRLRTLSTIFSTTATTIISAIALIMILKEVGFDVAPLLASAGVAGIAIGFGAQTLVKDILSGFFLLLDEQFDEGDEVEISGKKGVVEKINLRNIEIREKNGTLHIIPTGAITMVSNFSKK